ncbi:MAG TPA: HAD-IB family hydrolase [Mycobacteriales bacterium]|nr:HAD-IB family hydrolase [Mycobacteriales bacterium]
MPDDPLTGGHVLLTGATGFLGQAALERLLSSYPRTRVSVLIRRRGSQPAAERLAHLLRKPVFRHWREVVGEDVAAATVADRVAVVEGDLGTVPELPRDLTSVIHCASTVSFDPPIDEAFTTNLSGVTNLYTAVHRAGCRPHVVHVSTAYVAGSRKGVVPEASLDHSVDWRAELDAALAARAEVERDSRRPETLRRALRRAQAEHGKAGPQAVAGAAEEARRSWVSERLVDYGRTRARSLGWPDVYTFTKALGERAAEQLATGLPLSIVRPAIVESALHHPYPGWIDGFKMAEPIILAFGRGALPEFPGTPDGILDIVPVDIVTNALLAVAQAPPPVGEPAYYHVGSGSRNPLTFRDMYDNVREYFGRYPLPERGRGQIRVPTWKFPGGRRVERMLRTGERATELAEQALLRIPASGRTRDWMTRVHREQRQLDFLRRYADLYGVYTEAEVIYTDQRLLALHRSRSTDQQREQGFDSAVVDWRHYLQEVHCPSVTASLRHLGGSGRSPAARALTAGSDVMAVFDLEGTVLASNVVEGYLWARLAESPKSAWPAELAAVLGALPRYLAAERRDRGEFLRSFMRRYEGASEAELRRLVAERLGDALLRRAAPEAVRRIRAHRRAGHRTVLITGTVDVLVEPLRGLFDEIVASRLHAADGVYTGFLDRPPLVGEARAAWVRRYTADAGVDLAGSWAYADSYSDRPLLELVGNPVAVNPDPRLYRHAKRRRWTVAEWGRHTGGATEALLEAAR